LLKDDGSKTEKGVRKWEGGGGRGMRREDERKGEKEYSAGGGK